MILLVLLLWKGNLIGQSKPEKGTKTASQKAEEPARYNPDALFHEGLAPVCVDDKWGYINQDGDMVIEPQFEYALSFTTPFDKKKADGVTGYAPVGTSSEAIGDGRCYYGYINDSGTLIYMDLDYATSFNKNGLAIICEEGSYGIINESWEKVIPCNYNYIDGFFDDGYSILMDEFGCTIVDEKGNEISSGYEMIYSPYYGG